MSLHRPTPRMEPDPKLLAFVNERSGIPVAVRERAAFFVFFAQTLYPKLEEQRSALDALYSPTQGRPADDPVCLLGALLLQFVERLPDRQAAEAVCYDTRWRLALHLPDTEGGFDPSLLPRFRQRLLHEAQTQGRELLGPARPSPKFDRVLPVDQFDVHVEDRKAVCPAGQTNSQCSRIQEDKAGHTIDRMEWNRAVCQVCPLRSQCLGNRQTHRTIEVGQWHSLLQARRREMQTEAFKQDMHHRNGIEGTQSELVRAYGLRRARYRGLVKVRLQNYFIGAACNIRRWSRRLAWEVRQGLRPAGAIMACVAS